MGKYSVLWAMALGVLSAPGMVRADTPETVYYRYVDDQGVRVLEDRIPPEYVSKGYEVVSLSGQVINTVPPAPTEEQARQRELEQQAEEERAHYNRELKRRYSTVKDIRAAKRRNLAELQGNISILESNLDSVRARTRELESRAARQERSGQEVTESVLETLATLQTEAIEVQAQIGQREQEYAQVEHKFDRDMVRFEQMQERERTP